MLQNPETANTQVPAHHQWHQGPIVHHGPGFYQVHPPIWWHHWPITSGVYVPPSHDSPFFNPRAYDAVAPWTFENPPDYYSPWACYQGNYAALSPIEREMWQMKHHMTELFNGHHAFSSQLNLHPSRPGSLLEHFSLMNPIRRDNEGNRWLVCYFDLRSYKPEEVSATVNAKERYIGIEAAHEVNEAKEHYVKRHYSRKVYLPDDVKVEDLATIQLRAFLTVEGILCVEAPLPKFLPTKEATSPSISDSAIMSPINVYKIPVKFV